MHREANDREAVFMGQVPNTPPQAQVAQPQQAQMATQMPQQQPMMMQQQQQQPMMMQQQQPMMMQHPQQQVMHVHHGSGYVSAHPSLRTRCRT
jgi:protein-L-isoaspartate O-methyltransferase